MYHLKPIVPPIYVVRKTYQDFFDKGYVFRRLNARAKVFIEYVTDEKAWVPIYAPNYLVINCFWVLGQYKGQGYAKSLLQYAIDDATAQGKSGLVTVAGKKKFNFMSDGKWFLKQWFEIIEELSNGFLLLALKLQENLIIPSFKSIVKKGECEIKEGLFAQVFIL